MTPTAVAVAGGCLAGAGVWWILAVLLPRRVDLAAALAPDNSATPAAVPATADLIGAGTLRRWQRRLEVRLAATRLTTPDADLAVLEMDRGQFLLVRCAAVAGGLLVGPLYVLLFAALGVTLPLPIPAAAGVLLAVVGWFVPGMVVHGRAEERRREMRYALVAYLTLVALHRAAGQGIAAALNLAATSSPAWTFRRISGRIDSAVRSGAAPWDGIAALATGLGIDELADLASIADVAGTAGGGVYATLLARAQALRHELLSREEAAAAIMSARMVVPKAMLGLITLLFLLYPAVTQIAAT